MLLSPFSLYVLKTMTIAYLHLYTNVDYIAQKLSPLELSGKYHHLFPDHTMPFNRFDHNYLNQIKFMCVNVKTQNKPGLGLPLIL